MYTLDDLTLGEGSSLRYYIPVEWSKEDNFYVYNKHLRRYLYKLGYTLQDYYDTWILELKDLDARPRCPICDKEVDFKNITYGYRQYCSMSCKVIDSNIKGETGFKRYYSKTGVNLNFTSTKRGKEYFSKSGDVSFDSEWENFYFYKLEMNPEITHFKSQPLAIDYKWDDGTWHKYIPDALVNYKDGHIELVEIKPKKFIDDDIVLLKVYYAKIYCELNNMTYRIITEDELFT